MALEAVENGLETVGKDLLSEVEEKAPELIEKGVSAVVDKVTDAVSPAPPTVTSDTVTGFPVSGTLAGGPASVGTIVNRFTNVAATKAAALATIQQLDENNPETGVISLYVLEVANNPVLISNDLAYLDKKTSIAKKLQLRIDSAKSKVKTLLIVIITGIISAIASNISLWLH